MRERGFCERVTGVTGLAGMATVASVSLALLMGCGASKSPEPPVTRREPTPSSEPSAEVPAPSADTAQAKPTEPTRPTEPTEPTDVDKALAYDPKDPLGDLESADAIDRMGQPPGPLPSTAPPKGGCVALDHRRVQASKGPLAIAPLSRGFAVAGYAEKNGKEQVYLVRVEPAALPEPIVSLDVTERSPVTRIAPPGLAARADDDVIVAFTDGVRTLRARRLRMSRSGHGASVEIAREVDTRFAPAVTISQDRTLIAYTLGTTPMRSQLAVLSAEGQKLASHELTPAAMGAAAPVFVSGATPPVVLAVDARDGMSPIVRIDLGSDGEPSEPSVALPVSMVASPPELAAASSSVGTHLLYTGVGSAATTAVGVVAISPVVGSPEALVPGTAYGQLHVAATAAPRAVLLAADAPVAPGKDPEHEIHVHVLGTAGRGAATVLRVKGGASHVAIARDEAGLVGVGYSSQDGAFVALLRCDDQ